jgi:hypothetical protein
MTGRIGFALLASCFALAACQKGTAATSNESAVENLTSASHRDLLEVLRTPAQVEAYQTLRARLADEFDQICGDTFCGGDFGDLAPVQFACSATEDAADVRECLWTFGGSLGTVDAATGAVDVTAKTFSCRVPVGAGAAAFLATLGTSRDPLHEALPGSGASIWDALSDCLNEVGPLPVETEGPFVDLVEGAASEDELFRFFDASRALARGFDVACGDTFCEGEFSSIEPLSLRCSVDPSSGRLGGCTWAFAAAGTPEVASDGAVSAAQATFACRLPVAGTAGELIDALGAASDPLFVTLPGGDRSVNDVLSDCFQ